MPEVFPKHQLHVTLQRYDEAMLEQHIEQLFIDSADLKYQSAQILSKPMAEAVQLIMVSVTGGGKVLACGNGGSAALTQMFAATFIAGFERVRPELGAIALSADNVLLTSVQQDNGVDQVFAKQIRALGQPGDVLLFRWREGLAAKHAGIAVDHGFMIHAQDGARVCAVDLTRFWLSRLAYVFRFPG